MKWERTRFFTLQYILILCKKMQKISLHSFHWLIYVYNESALVMAAYNECFDMVERFDWYSLPTEFHRMLPLIFDFTQLPFEIIWFGSKACDHWSRYIQIGWYMVTYSFFTRALKSTIDSVHTILSGNRDGILVLCGHSSIW